MTQTIWSVILLLIQTEILADAPQTVQLDLFRATGTTTGLLQLNRNIRGAMADQAHLPDDTVLYLLDSRVDQHRILQEIEDLVRRIRLFEFLDIFGSNHNTLRALDGAFLTVDGC